MPATAADVERQLLTQQEEGGFESLSEAPSSALDAEVEAMPPRRRRRRGAAAVALGLGVAAAAAVVVTTHRGGSVSVASRSAATKGEVGLAEVVANESKHNESASKSTHSTSASKCAMAEKGSKCYKNVVWAMTEGIHKNPKWYPHLTKDSLFEDFQQHLSSDEKNDCPEPCERPGCETAKAGSACFDNVQWSKTAGISKHPEWYDGLSQESPAEDFQNHIHASNSTICPKIACNPQPFKPISLFCWLVVRPDGYELGLVKAQMNAKAGVFACDDFAVVSSVDLKLDGVPTLIISSTSVSGYTGDGTSPNAPIFVEAWDKIKEDGRFMAHDWVVKCDPDTVLVPKRLKDQLMPENQPENPYPPPFKPAAGAGQWVTNCDKMAGWGAGWGHGWPMMYGSIEIISIDALNHYYANSEMCKGSFPWQGMGEDAYMGLCLRKIETGELFIKQGDGACAGGVCTDKGYSAFHPRKDINSWMECWGQATR